ncbi:MAG: MOSC domain-containing protein, partial [Acetobacteraceae bacterium]|nr:MOSC domain-containing protein [Acetobacteraceae bacterium]
ARQIGVEAGLSIDKRRFRANIYAELDMEAFAENRLLGRRVRLGSRTIIVLTNLDPRCKMVTLDPDTAEAQPEVLRVITRKHDRNAGLYGAVLTEGVVRTGEEIALLD